ncbi:MAG: phosphoethanolamine--lipid A transferase [Sinobacteraceae bacterium]|nr:phosphoethanolamine--lipid A transferase [Nevskiaceae bacterium]
MIKSISLLRSRKPISATALTAWSTLWCLLVLNIPFWTRVLELRPLGDARDVAFVASVALLAALISNLFLMPLTLIRPLAKPLLSVALVLAALAAYFVWAYGVLVDKVMIRNVFETDALEAGELVNWKLLLFVGVLGVLPALAVLSVPLARPSWRRELLHRGVALGVTVVGIGLVAFFFYQDQASFLRNNRDLRHRLVPVNYLSGVGSYVQEITKRKLPYQAIGADAALGPRWQTPNAERPLLLVLVVGETARAANFSLGGYGRSTNPRLAEVKDLVYFTDVSSCGTSTAISVPCMFSDLGREEFSAEKARARDNLIDIVAKAGLGVAWYGNNTNCKGICRAAGEKRAIREQYPQYCTSDGPCMDGAIFEDFWSTLPSYSGRGLVVLHQLGSHGPGYHLRYPESFNRFTPVCRSTDFSKCEVSEIVNAYDNTILYTDHLLAETITRLQSMADRVDSAILYVSDHGESLGENGLFLHAVPYALAPRVQTHVPMVFWSSNGFIERMGIDLKCLLEERSRPLSHDNYLHTVLGLLDVSSSVRQPGLDFVRSCQRSAATPVG